MDFFNFTFLVLAKARKILKRRESARKFSNRVLKQYLKHFSGNIINVSGWEDSDKENNLYKNYFGSIEKYVISNIKGDHGMPKTKTLDSDLIYLDLEKPIADNLRNQFDVVFSHTVIEHIYNTQIALGNLAELSSDVIIIVVPFSQSVHYTNSYSDYVRLTPYYLNRFFEEKKFTTLLCCANEQPFDNVYLIYIASKYPNRYQDFFKNAPLNFDIRIQPSIHEKYD